MLITIDCVLYRVKCGMQSQMCVRANERLHGCKWIERTWVRSHAAVALTKASFLKHVGEVQMRSNAYCWPCVAGAVPCVGAPAVLCIAVAEHVLLNAIASEVGPCVLLLTVAAAVLLIAVAKLRTAAAWLLLLPCRSGLCDC